MAPSRALDLAMRSNRNRCNQGAPGDSKVTRVDKQTHILASRAVGNRGLQALMRRITAGNATIADRRAFQTLMNQIETSIGSGSATETAQQNQPQSSNAAMSHVQEDNGEASGVNRAAATPQNPVLLPPSSSNPASNDDLPSQAHTGPMIDSILANPPPSLHNRHLEASPAPDGAGTDAEPSSPELKPRHRRRRTPGIPFSFLFESEERPAMPSYPLRPSGSGEGR